MIQPWTDPRHHPSDAILADHAAGSLPYPFAVIVAAHLDLCLDCRVGEAAHAVAGGVVLDALAPIAVVAATRARVLAALDDRPEPAVASEPDGIYPAPLARLLGPAGPRWRRVGGGTRQAILWSGPEGSLRLLEVVPGQALPEHGHRGLEMALVLAGGYSDAGGRFRRGDVETADAAVDHAPVAMAGEICICAVAGAAPLRFRGLLPRLMQPILRM